MKFLSRLDDFEHIVIDGSVSGTGLSSLYLKDTATPILRIGNNTGDSFITYDGSELSISSDVDLRLTTPTDQDVFLITSSGNIVTTQAGGTFTIGGGLTLEAITGGFLKADANGVVSVDNSTYLTAETDTLDSVTGRGNTTTNNITVNSVVANGNITSANNYLILDSTANDRAVMLLDTSDNLVLQTGTASGSRGILFKTEGAEQMRIAHTGYVGIGTTSPSQKLDVVGRVRASYDANNYYEIGASSSGGFVVGKNGGTETVNIRTYGDSHFTGGNFGIGITSPLSKLHVNVDGSVARFSRSTAQYFDFNMDAANSNLDFYVGSNGKNVNLTMQGAHNGAMTFGTQGSERMRITSAGNVGIGTTSPDTKLHISDNLGGAVIRLERNDNAIVVGDIYGGIEFEGQDINTGASGIRGSIQGIAEASLGQMSLVFSTAAASVANTEKMRITSDGNVGIGTTSPTRTLHVAGTGRFTDNLYSTSTDVDGIKTRFLSGAANNSTNNGTLYLQYGKSNPVSIGETGSSDLYVAGNVGIGTTSPTAKLHVAGGRLEVDSNSNLPIIRARYNSNYYTDYDSNGINFVGTGQNFDVRDNGTTVLYLKSGGNVGIGTTSPDAKLHISHDSVNQFYIERTGSITGKFRIGVAGANNRFYITDIAQSQDRLIIDESGDIQLPAYGAGILTTDASGNVSLDTSTYLTSYTETQTLDDVTTLGATTTNAITVGGATFNGQTFHNGEVVIPSIGTANATTTEYNSQTLRFSASGWDTNNSVARTVNWNIRSEAASNIFPDAYLAFYEENISFNHWKLKLPGRGSGSSYIHPDAALFNGNIGIYESDTVNVGISLKPASDSYFTNNVGIGTTNPGAKLTVSGSATGLFTNLLLSNTNDTDGDATGIGFSMLNNMTYVKGGIFFERTDTGGRGSIHIATTNTTDSTSVGLSDARLTVAKDGNVGIGTTDPSSKLDVTDGNTQMLYTSASSDRPWLQLKHNAVPVDGEEVGLLDFRGYNDASEDTRYVILTAKAEDVSDGTEDGSLTFQTISDGTATQTLTMRSGNVGIGTANPNQLLHTVGGTVKIESDGGNASGAILELKHANNNTTDVCATINFTNNIGGYAAIEGGTTGANNTGYLAFKTDNAGTQGEAVRILGNGNVGIGNTAPSNTFTVGDNLTYSSSFNHDSLIENLMVRGSGSAPANLWLHKDDQTIFDTNDLGSIKFSGHNGTDSVIGGRIWMEASEDWSGSTNSTRMSFSTVDGTTSTTGLVIEPDGAIQLPQYTAGYLKSDASGNITVDTSTIEDTLQSVTDRGSSTTNSIAVAGVSSANFTSGTQGFSIESGDATVTTYRFDADKFRFYSGNFGEIVSIKENGNLGLGITNPSQKLSVNGNIQGYYDLYLGADKTSGSTILQLNNYDSALTDAEDVQNVIKMQGRYWTGNNSQLIQTEIRSVKERSNGNGDSGLAFATQAGGNAPAERMRIDHDGNVGIGTTGPGAKLDVSGNIRTSTYYNFNGNPSIPTTSVAAIFDQSGVGPTISGLNVTFRTGTTPDERMRITSGGNVGINTNNPTKLLTVGSGATASGISNNGIYVAVNGGAAVTARNTTNEVEIQLNAEVSQGTLGTFTNHPLAFRVNNSNKMWIDTSGNVGINTTSPGGRLHVVGNVLVQSGRIYTDAIQGYSANSITIGDGNSTFNIISRDNEDVAITGTGNVGIGTASPATKLHVVGTAETRLRVGSSNASSNVVLELRDENTPTGQGTVITYNNATGETYFNNAMSSATTDFHFQSGEYGTASDFFTLSNSGGNPILHLKSSTGDSFITYEDATNELSISSDNDLRLTTPTDQNVFFISSGGNVDMTQAGGTVDMGGNLVVDGNVGIGTATPTEKFEISSGSASNLIGKISQTNTAYQAWWQAESQDGKYINVGVSNNADNYAYINTSKNTLRFLMNSSVKMAITSGGNVGIGTTNPDTKLQVAATGSVGLSVRSNTSGDAYMRLYSDATIEADWFIDRSASTINFRTVQSKPLVFATNNSEAMRILSGGNVGIGTTNPGYKLTVDNDALNTNNPALYVKNPNSSTAAVIAEFVGDSDSIQIKNIGTGDYVIYNSQQSNGIALYDGTGGVEIHYNGATVLEADSNGGVKVTGQLSATGDVVAYSSDERLKENINPIENAVDKIKQLKGVTFDWNEKSEELGFEPSTKTNDVGVIAQDVEAVFPQLVQLAPFDIGSDEDGNATSKSGEDYKTVNYARLTAVLIEAVKEQQQQIDELKAKLDGITK